MKVYTQKQFPCAFTHVHEWNDYFYYHAVRERMFSFTSVNDPKTYSEMRGEHTHEVWRRGRHGELTKVRFDFPFNGILPKEVFVFLARCLEMGTKELPRMSTIKKVFGVVNDTQCGWEPVKLITTLRLVMDEKDLYWL
jgi:hypothetical protein